VEAQASPHGTAVVSFSPCHDTRRGTSGLEQFSGGVAHLTLTSVGSDCRRGKPRRLCVVCALAGPDGGPDAVSDVLRRAGQRAPRELVAPRVRRRRGRAGFRVLSTPRRSLLMCSRNPGCDALVCWRCRFRALSELQTERVASLRGLQHTLEDARSGRSRCQRNPLTGDPGQPRRRTAADWEVRRAAKRVRLFDVMRYHVAVGPSKARTMFGPARV